MIVIMDMLSSLSAGIFCIVFTLTGELNMLSVYILVMLLSTISAFFTPPMSAIIPDIVPREHLADANSIRMMPDSILGLISPLAAGLLFGMFGLLPIMIVNAVSFFASAISEMFIRIKKESIAHKEDGREPYFTSLKNGLKFIKTMPEIILMTGIAVFANFALSPIFSVALPVVLLQDFGVSEQLYGLFNSITTVGMILAPIFAAKIIKKHHYSKLVWTIIAFDGILSILIAVLSINGLFPSIMINYISMIIIINILIMTVMWVNLALATAMQVLVPGNMMGRVSSVLGTFSMVASPIGIALMGSLLEFTSSSTLMGIYSFVVIIVGIVAKAGFTSLERKGKMDITIGLSPVPERIEENV